MLLIDFRRKGVPVSKHDPTPVDTGPQRPCVLTHKGRWYPFLTFYDAIQYGCFHGLIGAEIRVCGCKGPDARIEPPLDLEAIAASMPTGRPAAINTTENLFGDGMVRRSVA